MLFAADLSHPSTAYLNQLFSLPLYIMANRGLLPFLRVISHIIRIQLSYLFIAPSVSRSNQVSECSRLDHIEST
jgi:hypothetical protein